MWRAWPRCRHQDAERAVRNPVNTSNPKAIPDAALRYCILVTNPGTLTASATILAPGASFAITFDAVLN